MSYLILQIICTVIIVGLFIYLFKKTQDQVLVSDLIVLIGMIALNLIGVILILLILWKIEVAERLFQFPIYTPKKQDATDPLE